MGSSSPRAKRRKPCTPSAAITNRTSRNGIYGAVWQTFLLQLFYNVFASLPSFLSPHGPYFHIRRVHYVTLLYCVLYTLLLPSVPLLLCSISGLGKIIKKKHDKQMRENLIAKKYLGTRAKYKYSFLRQLHHNEGILSLVARLKRSVRRKRTLLRCGMCTGR